MIHAIRVMALAVVMLSLQACSPVVTTQPIGTTVGDELSGFNGAWLVEDVVLHVQATASGRATVARTEWKDGWHVTTYDAVVTQVGEMRLLHLLAQGESHWAFWLMHADQDLITLHIPNATELASAAEEGDVPGEVSYTDDGSLQRVLLDATDAGVLGYFERARPEALFKLDEPTLMRRIKKAEK
jgi:hypothetical protein